MSLTEIPLPIQGYLEQLLDEFECIDGFIVGGSIAAKNYQQGKDVDVYIVYSDSRYINSNMHLKIKDRFLKISKGIMLDVPDTLARDHLKNYGIPDSWNLEGYFRDILAIDKPHYSFLPLFKESIKHEYGL